MPKDRAASRRTRRPQRRTAPWPWLAVGALLLAAAGLAVATIVLGQGRQTPGATPWARLGTADVHALAFDPRNREHLLFGHHHGVLETTDGGRSWHPLGLQADAMNVSRPRDGFFQVAGHDVYKETTDGGHTWQDVPNDLPGLDLHGFVADPADPGHAWTFAVGFGLFETIDRGRTWELRHSGNWGALAAFSQAGKAILVGIGPSGLARSDDGGRTWALLGQPQGQPASLAASDDGSRIYAGTTQGLSRSADGGRTWAPTSFTALPLAVAVYPPDPQVVAVVDEQTRFYRSIDAGDTWPGP